MYQIQARVAGDAPKGWESGGVDLPTFYVDAITENSAVAKAREVINPPGTNPREIRSMTLLRITDWYGVDIRTDAQKEEDDNRTPEEKEAALNAGVAVLSARLGSLIFGPHVK